MDSGSAECVAPESIAKSIPLVQTEASRQGQTYHTADGDVIRNKGEKTVTMYSETGDQYRAQYQIADVTQPLNSVSRVCDQGNNVFFTQTGGWIINRETGRYTWFPWINEFPTERVRWPDEPFPGQECKDSAIPRNTWNLCKTLLEESGEMDEEDMDDKEERTEESRAVRVGQKKKMTPTLAEREDHERTHIPYRSWCRLCIAARASNLAHRGRNFAKAAEQVSYVYCLCEISW